MTELLVKHFFCYFILVNLISTQFNANFLTLPFVWLRNDLTSLTAVELALLF